MSLRHVDQDDAFDNPRKRKSHEVDPWYKRYARDFFDDTRDLTPEQRGLYNDAIDMIYMIEGPIKDDDRILAHKMCVDVRTWRRVRKTLLAQGKLFITRGHLFNKRAREVLARREVERRLMGRSAGDRPEIGPDLFENHSEINDPVRARSQEAEAEAEREEEKKDSKPAALEYDAASLRADDEVISNLKKWKACDEVQARVWLNRLIKTYGEGPARAAYNILLQRIDAGTAKTPIGLWGHLTKAVFNGEEEPENKRNKRYQERMRVARETVNGMRKAS